MSNMVRLQWSQAFGIRELDNADGTLAQALSSPSQGMWLQGTAIGFRSDTIRPVIVAENMIGCAMYELVRECPASRTKLNRSYAFLRSVSVMTA